MRKKILKFLCMLFIVLFAFSSFYPTIAEAGIVAYFSGDIENANDGATKITEIISIILEVVRNVGAGVAVLILIIIGCKYILASAGDRAEIKKHAVTYVIGAIVLFASSGIAGILQQFALSATSSGGN